MRLFCFSVLLLFGRLPISAQETGVSGLRCDFLERPVGVESPNPALSWIINSSTRGQVQTAFQILVASAPDKLSEARADLWNSGKRNSQRSVNVPYRGKPLVSGQRCYWTVRIWDKSGDATAYSEYSFWEMGLLNKADWQAKWISSVAPADTTAPVLPAPFFRKEFSVKRKPLRARLYISGIGYSEAYLNGEKISDRVLDPAVTRYDKRRKYVVHDVTSQVHAGKNVIGVILGNGWYNQHSATAWDFDQAPWRDSPRVLAQLLITWSDGRTEVVGTDQSWKFSSGPITFNDVHNGEHYDARKELSGWSSPGYSSHNWKPAYEVDAFAGELSPHLMPPVRVTKTLTPVRSDKVGDTVVYDFGQNMSGWVKLTVKGNAGAEVVIRHGERLNAGGTLDIKELSRFIFTGEVQTDRYILKGGESETWHPRFTYHGFQYAEVILPREAKVETIEAEVVHTDFATQGTFTCSDTLLNKIHQNLKWSYLTNYHSYPTDCPHREKIGWTGDAHLVAEAGLFNFDAYSAYRKLLDDFADEQRPSGDLPGIIPTSGWGYTLGKGENRNLGYGPQWEGAYVLIAWQLYRYTADSSLIKKHYGSCKRYVDFLSTQSKDDLIAFGIDDHKQLRQITEGDILSAGLYYHLATIVSRMAGVAGLPDDQRTYEALSVRIRRAFNGRYYNPETGIYGKGGQTQLSEALYLGLVEKDEEQRVLANLLDAISQNNFRVETGVVGTKWLIHALMDAGRDDVLHRMVSHTDFPGWGYWIRLGATTLFQNWDATQSRNHIMFGTIGDYFYQGLAGIRADVSSPGFKRFFVKPLLNNDLTFTTATYQSPFGRIGVDWKKDNDVFRLQTEVPVNTTAIIHLPVSDPAHVFTEGQPVADAPGVISVRATAKEVLLEVGSGIYNFEIRNSDLKK